MLTVAGPGVALENDGDLNEVSRKQKQVKMDCILRAVAQPLGAANGEASAFHWASTDPPRNPGMTSITGTLDDLGWPHPAAQMHFASDLAMLKHRPGMSCCC